MNILWDFDGTIFNTYPAYTKIVKEVLEDRVTEDEIYKLLKVSFSHALKYFNLTDEKEIYIRSRVRELKPDDLYPFPHVEDILKNANKNVIMTHKEREDVINILTFHRLEHYFVDMVAGDDGFPRKPDSASYKHLHDKHRIELAIGDRELDIIPAKQLGMKTCLFQNNTVGADFYLNDYKDFNSVIKL
ncbi:HAD-IA family hydrolase [Cytobacillus sp. FJAT-54145]|uniref:HAD-IA family hydrolase n=1 Tax=Cytobacillus spartinae TaxID=3299023 RepID=A0ABW6K8N5_9BACI